MASIIQSNTVDAQVQINKYFVTALALFIIPISGLAIDIYVPSLPSVSNYFHVSKSMTQLTITAYMIGLGVMQLFAGGISDSYGRKKPFLIAMAVFIIATFAITFVQSINQLLLLRFIQGITIAVIVVPMRAIVSDLFTGSEYYKMTNYMVIAWSIGPIVAPAIGGYLQSYFGWQANFHFLLAYSVIGFILIAAYMPETSIHKHPFQISKMLERYKEMLFHREYMNGLITNGLLYSFVIIFATVAPFLIQNVLHYSAIEFGYIALLSGFAWFAGAVTNRFLVNISLKVKSKVILSAMLLIATIAAITDIFIPMNIYSIVTPILMLLWLGGTLLPNYFAKSISLFPKFTGSANALFGSFLFLISGTASGLATYLKSTNQLPLMLTYIVLISICLLIRFVNRDCLKC